MQTFEIEAPILAVAPVLQWYAVHTRYQHEELVNEQLETKGFETFYPTYTKLCTWKDRKKKMSRPLFPGYLFITDIGERRLQIVATPGVCSIVSVAGAPAPIPGSEIEAIRRATSGPYTVEPHPYLKAGDLVRVNQGPLSGVSGILVRQERSSRLVLSVELLGRAVAVEIDGNCVEPVAN